MSMLSPVAGLRPWRAGRLRVAKVPKPAMETLSPRASASAIVANTAATALSAVALVTEARVATLDASSVLFMAIPPSRCDGTSGGIRLRIRVPRRRKARNGRTGEHGGVRRCGPVRRGVASARLNPAAGARSRARWPRAGVTARGPRPIAGPRTPFGSGSARTGPAGAGETRPGGGRGR